MDQPEPDYAGIARAWRIEATEELAARHVKEWGHGHGGISNWIVNGPYHLLWSWWSVACVHLRQIPDAPPPVKHYPGAEYEFMVFSLDSPPSGRITPNIEAIRRGEGPEDGARGSYLHPPDVVYQFHGVTDAQAAEITEAAIRIITSGQSCDSDHRGWWLNALAGTVRHYQEGVH